jgi:hypothetical protein
MVQGDDKMCALMLFGAVGRPIPSYTHLRRECFVFSSIVSLPARDAGSRVVYRRKEDGQLRMTNTGREAFNAILEEHSDDPDFVQALAAAVMIREIYDDMSHEEISLLESR